MNEKERNVAIKATEESIKHHKQDVLAAIESGVPLRIVSSEIGGDDCALCAKYIDLRSKNSHCKKCPLFQFGAWCDAAESPWRVLAEALDDHNDDREAAITASRHMIITLEAVRAMLTLTATSEKEEPK